MAPYRIPKLGRKETGEDIGDGRRVRICKCDRRLVVLGASGRVVLFGGPGLRSSRFRELTERVVYSSPNCRIQYQCAHDVFVVDGAGRVDGA